MFAQKRAQSSAPGEVEGAVEPSFLEEDTIILQNTLAAWRSRKRKLEYQRELEDALHAEHKDKETWRAHALVLEALLCDKGHEVPPQMIEYVRAVTPVHPSGPGAPLGSPEEKASSVRVAH